VFLIQKIFVRKAKVNQRVVQIINSPIPQEKRKIRSQHFNLNKLRKSKNQMHIIGMNKSKPIKKRLCMSVKNNKKLTKTSFRNVKETTKLIN
jgi:hypothetical protein